MFYSVLLTSPWVTYIFVNNRYRKPKWQTKTDNPDKLATSGMQDTDDDQQTKPKYRKLKRRERETTSKKQTKNIDTRLNSGARNG